MPLFAVVLIVIATLVLFTWLIPVQLWLSALFSGVKVGIFSLIAMRIRRVPPATILNSMIMAFKAGLTVTSDALEAHFLAKGNVPQVVRALITADKAGIPLTFEKACAIDLAGRDILEAVQMSVRPKVIDAPDPTKGKSTVDAVAMDGIQLLAKARVTVRANLDRLVGGAGEETIIARVGEGIVTTIGSSETHKKVLENPDSISKQVLSRGLDAGTAFEILSIDIADIDVGDNIGARLQAKQAQADLQIAKAKAEERRAMAVAKEQEMLAKVQDMRAKVVEAEAEVPKAIAEAFRKGNLGIMDYYRMKNIKADTDMRDSIADSDKKEKKE